MTQSELIYKSESRTFQPLKTVVLYSAGHLGSTTILNRLIESPEFEFAGIVKAKPLPFNRQGARKLKKELKNMGWRFGWLVIWQQMIQGVGFALNSILPFTRNRLMPTRLLSKKFNVPVFHCENVNDASTEEFISSRKPDLIVSAYFNQILKKNIIDIPRIGVLNVHPGWLPGYRGAMCYFWVLKNGEQKGGVTVHWIDEGIDTGEILARKTFDLKPGWTQQMVLVRTAVIGAVLLKQLAGKLCIGEIPQPVCCSEKEDAVYYPMPGREDFEDYFDTRRFFRIRDVIRYFVKTIRR